MVVSITFDAAPNPVKVGETLRYHGNVSDNGTPLVTENVQIYDVATATMIFDVYTDENGDYEASGVALEEHIGSWQVQAYVPAHALLSEVITLVVTEDVPTRNLLWLIGVGFIGLYLMSKGRK